MPVYSHNEGAKDTKWLPKQNLKELGKMAKLRGMEIIMEFDEEMFKTRKTVTIYFEHEKDLMQKISDVLTLVKKVTTKALKEFGRPRIDVLGMDTDYRAVDGYRYVCEYQGTTTFRKWDGHAYVATRTEEYHKKEGYREADVAKQMRDLFQQMQKDITDYLLNNERLVYRSLEERTR